MSENFKAEYKTDKGRLWLYENSYKQTDKHPVLTGRGEISKDVLKKLVDLIKASKDDVVPVQCAAWERVSKNGNAYTFVTLEPGDGKQYAKKQDEPEIEVPF